MRAGTVGTRALRGLAAFCLAALVACGGAPRSATPKRVAEAPAWTRGAVCYEIFVRSFQDSDGDGIGDLKGLIRKLDYINDGSGGPASLGARCIWLMPVAASPSYHGYDVADYYRVNPQYGTNEDFRRLVAEAHRRGIRVLVDMVLNHSSDQSAWFQSALADTTSPYRAWYRFSRTKPLVKAQWRGELWHRSPVRDEYYYGVFSAHMPDLNYENPATRAEAVKIARFWLTEMGVDGFRLDAVEYLVEQGDSIRNTPGTHAFLHEWADSVHATRPDAYTVGEATWGKQDVLMTYYPDQLDSYFPFELSDSLIAGVRNGSARGILPLYLRLQAALPGTRYSPFLRNHDQTRTLTALGGDVRRARVAATLLLTLPGVPFVYYGEEIGMSGDKPDERLRTPMQWSAAASAGFTTGTPWEPLQPDWPRVNVAAQDGDPASLLNLYRRLIHLRAQRAALGSGELVPLSAPDAVAAYLRRDGAGAVLVLANLGAAPLAGVALRSGAGALPPGAYTATDLLDGTVAAMLHVDAAGRVTDYVPVPVLGGLQARVLGLARSR